MNDTGSRGATSGNDPAPALSVVAPDTDTLVARVQGGDRWAFTELFRRHRTDVLRLVHRMMGASPEVEDIVQEVFLQVHRSIGEFRGQSKFSTWLHRVTVNVVLMHRRAARSRPAFTGEAPTDMQPDSKPAPDEDTIRHRQIEAFRRLLSRLPEKKRVVFELHELCGWSPAAIAEHVSAPVLTVRTRLFYARREIEALVQTEPALAQLAEELRGNDADDPNEGSAGAKPVITGTKEAP